MAEYEKGGLMGVLCARRITDQIDWFADTDKWEGLRSFGIVYSVR